MSAWLLLLILAIPLSLRLFATWKRQACIPASRGRSGRYSSKKVPANLDAIVIGSGPSGLATAALLAKSGKRVLVLEQHYEIGGTLHMFKSDRASLVKWETGVHYIGHFDWLMKRLMSTVCASSIAWKHTQEFDKIVIGSARYSVCAGWDQWTARLRQWFPSEREAIARYRRDVQRASSHKLYYLAKVLPPWCANLAWTLAGTRAEFVTWVTLTMGDYVRQLTTDKDLRAVLCGQFADYGNSPDTCPFYFGASVVNHYVVAGAWYPVGGSSAIVKAIVPTIEASGGLVLTARAVERILFSDDGKTVVGVQMAKGGEVHRAPIVVSACGVGRTFTSLLSREIFPVSYWEKMQAMIPRADPAAATVEYIFLFVHLQPGSRKLLGLTDANVWYWPHNDHAKMLDDYLRTPLVAGVGMPLFVASGSLKGGEVDTGDTLIVLTFGRWEWFKEYQDERHKHRSAEYQNLKDRFRLRMLETVEANVYPGITDCIVSCDVATPLSYRHYFHTVRGECYGLPMTPSRFLNTQQLLVPKTPVKGLYLAGQDICTLGFTGACMSSLLTTVAVLGWYQTARILCLGSAR